MKGRRSFWILVSIMTFAWSVGVLDFYIGVPQSEGWMWEDNGSFSPVYLSLRILSDAAVSMPFISVALLMLLFATNIWLLKSIWSIQTGAWTVFRNRLSLSMLSLTLPIAYLVIVFRAAATAAERLMC